MNIVHLASLLIGVTVGIIAAAMFSVILRRIEHSSPTEAVKALRSLIYLLLGSGLGDLVIFDFILRQSAIEYYLLGLGAAFVPLSLTVYFDWRRGP